ncbi:MAG: FAD-binding oxidoreductase [Curvibacter sp.]|nr:FAD-binding oxidoreductase [Curvibacter sp.]
MASYSSWGRYPATQQQGSRPRFDDELPGALQALPADSLVFGNGRSYGDSVIAPSAQVLDLRQLDRVLHFDRHSGRLQCEAGLLLSDLIRLALPCGWFPAVTPGTRFVTVGGAVANDVHGKNHHGAGSFGDQVLGLELLRSDGSRRRCSREQHSDWFAATIGGLGLTGVITRVELQLRPVAGPWLHTESIKFGDLGEFFELSAQSNDWEYTVAWIDCLAKGRSLGRGHFLRANHAGALAEGKTPSARQWAVPFTPPLPAVNRLTLPAFNALYYHRQRQRCRTALQHYQPYFYPLDSILDWNRLYGPRGFQQYQCVLPPESAEEGVKALLGAIARSAEGSFLAVLKQFGDRRAPGWLSFARPGTTLALDFAQRGPVTQTLFAELDAIVEAAAGALYPAKDAHMGSALFRKAYPRWEELEARRDPQLNSAFWRRTALASHRT